MIYVILKIFLYIKEFFYIIKNNFQPDIDSGAIIEQAAVPVLPHDTIETLQERVKTVEHCIFPLALKHLATGRIQLNEDNSITWNY